MRHALVRAQVTTFSNGGALSGWAQTPLPMLRPPGQSFWFGHQVSTELPHGLEAIQPTVHSIPGGVTLVVMCGLLDDATATRVDRALKRTYRTQITGQDGERLSFAPPEMVQREAVQCALRDQRALLADWLRDVMPGAFTGGLGETLPTAQLLTFRTDEALRDASYRHWSTSLALDQFDRWRSERWPAIELVQANRLQGQRPGLTFFGLEDAIRRQRDEQERDLTEDEGWFMSAQELGRSFDGLMALWALVTLVDAYAQSLAEIRDLPAPPTLRPRHAAARLKQVQRQVRQANDIRAVASDLAERTSDRSFRFYDGGDWIPRRQADGVEGRWIRSRTQWVREQAARVLELEIRVRDRLSVEVQVFGAGAGLQVQRLALWVAVAACLVGAAALGVAVSQHDPCSAAHGAVARHCR